MRKIILALMNLKLEYSEAVLVTHIKNSIKKMERMQRVVTKFVPDLKELLKEERLKEIQLTTLKETRELGDLTTINKLGPNRKPRKGRCNGCEVQFPSEV